MAIKIQKFISAESVPPSMGSSLSFDELLLHILKNSKKAIFDEGMCLLVITSVSGILAQMKCLKVI